MEENEKIESEVTIESDYSEKKGVVEVLKEKKSLIIVIVVAIIILCVVYNIFFNTKGKAKSVAKDYYSAISKKNAKKMYKCVDPYGSYVFAKLDKDDYKDFWEEYNDFLDSDDYEDYKEEYEDDKDDNIEKVQDVLDDYMDDVSIKLKDVKEVKKVGKNLYKVKVKVEIKEDDDKETETEILYVMKKGLSCYIVGGDAASFLNY